MSTSTWQDEAAKAVNALHKPFVPGFEGMFDRDDFGGLYNAAKDYMIKNVPGWNVDTLVSFLASKQRDYGPQNITKFGIQGLKVRMWDKIARINNLVAQGREPSNESLVDSYVDLMGYCVIAVMVTNGTFNTPLAPEVEPF